MVLQLPVMLPPPLLLLLPARTALLELAAAGP
jgi:hypothetical protein